MELKGQDILVAMKLAVSPTQLSYAELIGKILSRTQQKTM